MLCIFFSAVISCHKHYKEYDRNVHKLAANCRDYKLELLNVSDILQCEHLACVSDYNVYEYDGNKCRFYVCTERELANFPTTSFWGAFDVYIYCEYPESFANVVPIVLFPVFHLLYSNTERLETARNKSRMFAYMYMYVVYRWIGAIKRADDIYLSK